MRPHRPNRSRKVAPSSPSLWANEKWFEILYPPLLAAHVVQTFSPVGLSYKLRKVRTGTWNTRESLHDLPSHGTKDRFVRGPFEVRYCMCFCWRRFVTGKLESSPHTLLQVNVVTAVPTRHSCGFTNFQSTEETSSHRKSTLLNCVSLSKGVEGPYKRNRLDRPVYGCVCVCAV